MQTDLSPKNVAWLREQVRQEVEHRMAPLRRELDGMDDWANGVFAALLDLLLPLLKTHPELGRTLEALWGRAAEQYAELERSPERRAELQTTPELLEARKMLYWVLAQLGHGPARTRRARRKPVS
ncbi:hypothetical protein G8A07_15685 [Roseateles sp. DAIF2]|uniref:hypothetical protein n=1 Tax=Roseateles sp. DAIF2 TaxID=2714952 RepID=UPI0018A2B930|nr:hypothetical protein [Roseateles sp. DAIF2]QPF74216.1 hypothetical protein G8A07_15685 [Roseateles sp. DAIF2]